MESLYTKYRPQTFEQVVGQSHVVETLKRAVLENRTSHAYLFCGPRGTGKTTMARILAKALMCERGPAALPDGTCEQCRLIAAGEHPDVIELDAASRTGVDNVREEIISRVNYAPTMGRCKVYIIDEVHMLTTAAFNALLKTLEEPPEHVVFIMCTTDPQKILATILSRVQRFDFHAIGNEEMQAHLAYVCSQEGFTYDEAALELVVRHARGGMRDALTSLEQLSVFGGGSIDLAGAADFLGEVSGSVLGTVSRAMAHRDVPALFSEVAELVDAGRDLLQFTRELAAHVRDVYVVSVAPSAEDVVSARGDELDALRAEAAAFGSSERLARVLTVLGDASSEMRTATNQRLVLEIALTRVARPASDLTLESLSERLSDLERQVAILSAPGARSVTPSAEKDPEQPVVAQPAMPTTPAQPAAPAQVPPTASAPEVTPEAVTLSSAAGEKNVESVPAAIARPASGPAAKAPAGQSAPAAGASPSASHGAVAPRDAGRGVTAGSGLSDGNLQRAWKQVVDRLVAQMPAKGSLLLSSTAVSDDGERLTVSLPKGSRFAARMLERADVRASVEPVVAMAFGPRQVLYVESSLASQAISTADRAAAVPTVAPAPAPVPTPAPQPAPAPQPGPAPKPAPQPVPSQVPQPAPAPAPGYPMPWDAPVREEAPAPAPSVDDVVPYSDADATPYEEDPELAPPAAPSAEVSPAVPTPAPAASVTTAPAPASVTTAPAPAPAPAPSPAPVAFGAPTAADPGLSPEFASIVSELTAAFGQPLSVSLETAATTSDEDAAAELAGEASSFGDAGFTDEPVDDGDDD